MFHVSALVVSPALELASQEAGAVCVSADDSNRAIYFQRPRYHQARTRALPVLQFPSHFFRQQVSLPAVNAPCPKVPRCAGSSFPIVAPASYPKQRRPARRARAADSAARAAAIFPIGIFQTRGAIASICFHRFEIQKENCLPVAVVPRAVWHPHKLAVRAIGRWHGERLRGHFAAALGVVNSFRSHAAH